MNRPPLEVADLVRAAGQAFFQRSRKWITWQHLKVLRAIARCRTAALGGHLDECTDCGYRPAISYNSCRDRHCQSVRPTRATVGSQHVARNFCPRLTFMLCSPYPM